MSQKTLRNESEDYEPKRTLNIADLDKVDLNWPVEDREGKKKNDNDEEEIFKYKAMIVNELEYRVPPSVLEEIQKILKIKPDAKFVKVIKKGSGFSTSYDVEFIE